MNSRFFANHQVLNTRLTPDECEARLRARLAGWPRFRNTPEHPVAGSVSSSGFSLTKAIGGRNSFQTEARGTFVKRDDGTRIEVTLGPSPVVLVFGAIWILFVLGLLMSAFSGGLEFGGSTRLEPWAIPVGMLLIGVVMFGLGRFSARGEGAFLLRFLQQELKAAIGR